MPSVQEASPEVLAAAASAAKARVLPAEAVRVHVGGNAGARAARRRLGLLQKIHQVNLRAGTHVQGQFASYHATVTLFSRMNSIYSFNLKLKF